MDLDLMYCTDNSKLKDRSKMQVLESSKHRVRGVVLKGNSSYYKAMFRGIHCCTIDMALHHTLIKYSQLSAWLKTSSSSSSSSSSSNMAAISTLGTINSNGTIAIDSHSSNLLQFCKNAVVSSYNHRRACMAELEQVAMSEAQRASLAKGSTAHKLQSKSAYSSKAQQLLFGKLGGKESADLSAMLMNIDGISNQVCTSETQ